MNSFTRFHKQIAFSLLCSLAFFSCGKSLRIEGANPSVPASGPRVVDGGDGGLPIQCGPDQMAYWQFVQPQPTTNRSVDLLFVVDTSDSLSDKRARLARTIPSFLRQIPSNGDCRVAVLLAHGGASRYSGRLYAPPGAPLVLNTRAQSSAELEALLTNTLMQNAADADEANGEVLMYALQQSLKLENRSMIQSQGFYRSNAALSVVFISDENDLCYRPELNGFTEFPDFVPSFQNREVTAYNRYCINNDGSPRITAESTMSALRSFKNGQLISLGAIVHTDPARVPRVNQESIGHGILHLMRLSANNMLMDVMDNDYAAGLAKLGNIASTQLQLLTEFRLQGVEKTRRDSIRVTVDERAVVHRFDAALGAIQISAEQAGRAGSIVKVSACRLP